MNAVAETVLDDFNNLDVATEGELIAPCDNIIPLSQFVADFGEGLLEAVSRQNPPVYDGCPDSRREAVMLGIKRTPFPAQADVVQAVTRLLIDHGAPAAVINAEMGTGKTMMAICAAAVMHAEGYTRTLVISPPHLVYKWRREILETVPGARVWVLNGPDTLRKLLQLRAMLNVSTQCEGQEFFVMGRVRMRMGFHWRPAVTVRKFHRRRYTEEGNEASPTFVQTVDLAACPRCGAVQTDAEGHPLTRCGYHAYAGDKPQSLPAMRRAVVDPDASGRGQRSHGASGRGAVPDPDHWPQDGATAGAALRC